MNIVHLQLSGGIGGISVLTRDLAGISDHNNIFYFLFEGGVIADDMAKNGSLVHIEDGKHFAFLSEAKKFTAFCKKNNADVIIAHTGSPICRFLAAYAKKHIKNTKLLVYFHSNAYLGGYNSKIKKILDDEIEKFAFRNCKNAVAISDSVKESFVKKYNFRPDKIKVVYNGVDTEKFAPDFNKPTDCFKISYVGRVLKFKGIHTLIEAVSLLPYNDIKIQIIGRAYDGYDKELTALAREKNIADRVTLCGAQTNVEKWLAKSCLFVHPTMAEEGFGLTLVEALACGVPCAAFDEGAMREIIDNGKNGFISKEMTAEGLAKAIEKIYLLWKNNYNSYIKMCRYSSESAKRFEISNTLKNLESLY